MSFNTRALRNVITILTALVVTLGLMVQPNQASADQAKLEERCATYQVEIYYNNNETSGQVVAEMILCPQTITLTDLATGVSERFKSPLSRQDVLMEVYAVQETRTWYEVTIETSGGTLVYLFDQVTETWNLLPDEGTKT